MPVALAVVVGLVLVTAVGLKVVASTVTGCTGGLPLRVVTTPQMYPVLNRIADSWRATKPEVEGECVDLTVLAQDSATVAADLSVFAGGSIDVAAAPRPTPGEDSLPSVWVPDATAWLYRVQGVDRSAFVDAPKSIATSPVVIAMPEAAAKQLGSAGGRLSVATLAPMLVSGGLKLAVAEPRRESTSLAAVMLLSDALATSDDQLPTLVRTLRGLVKTASTSQLLGALGGGSAVAGPASEQDVLAHDASGAQTKLVAVQLDPALPELDYPYAIRSGVARKVAQAAEAFRTAVQADAAQPIFAHAGFRTPDGTAGPGFPQSKATPSEQFVGNRIEDAVRVARTLTLWGAANSPSRTLALFDVTSSMGTFVPAAGTTRVGVMAAAAKGGLELFTNDSRVGMWAFGAAHQEVLPIAELTPQRRSQFDQAMTSAHPAGSNQAELYSTLLDAYKVMQDGYDPSRPNIIVVLTDGGDSAPGGKRLEQFRLDAQKIADPTRPIRVVLIGIGVGSADITDLQAISGVLGGSFFSLTNPTQIQAIFLKALLGFGT